MQSKREADRGNLSSAEAQPESEAEPRRQRICYTCIRAGYQSVEVLFFPIPLASARRTCCTLEQYCSQKLIAERKANKW